MVGEGSFRMRCVIGLLGIESFGSFARIDNSGFIYSHNIGGGWLEIGGGVGWTI